MAIDSLPRVPWPSAPSRLPSRPSSRAPAPNASRMPERQRTSRSAPRAPQHPWTPQGLPWLSVTPAPERGEVVVAPVGGLDLAASHILDREVRRLRRAGFDRVVVDLSRVALLDSAGLRALLSMRNDAKRQGGVLELVPGPRNVQRVFRLTATHGLFAWRRA